MPQKKFVHGQPNDENTKTWCGGCRQWKANAFFDKHTRMCKPLQKTKDSASNRIIALLTPASASTSVTFSETQRDQLLLAKEAGEGLCVKRRVHNFEMINVSPEAATSVVCIGVCKRCFHVSRGMADEAGLALDLRIASKESDLARGTEVAATCLEYGHDLIIKAIKPS